MSMTNAERVRAHRQRSKAIATMTKMPTLLQRLKAAELPPPALSVVEAPKYDGVQFDSVICDWLTIVHPISPQQEPLKPMHDGKIFKINADGSTEWETACWATLRSDSSDTSIRIKCDGETIKMTGNIGRYGYSDNLNGFTVSQCIELWRVVVNDIYPSVHDFFAPPVQRVDRSTGELSLFGTHITRCDLAGNFWTDNFAALSAQLMTHRIGQMSPRVGKYGPTWGYDSKRANWFRAKVYDKTCELEGRRTPASGATVARFEVQLGSELLKRQGLHLLNKWKDFNMENVIYLNYSKQVFKEQATAENWSDIPPRLRQYAVLWRDGVPLMNQCKSRSTYFRIRSQLLKHGIDASQPCNITTLTRRVEVVTVRPLPARRAA